MSEVKLPFGVRKGKLVHISLVDRGLACKCLCPGCETELVAKKGSTAHHFAHHVSNDCSYAPETSLHQYAKQLLADQRSLFLPPLVIEVKRPEYGITMRETIPGDTLAVTDVWLELSCDDVVPDVQYETTAGRHLVEVAVTHFADRDKRIKLARIGYPAQEIRLDDISPDAPLEEIHAAVLNEASRRSWLFHPLASELEVKLNASAKAREAEVIRLRTPIPEPPRVRIDLSLVNDDREAGVDAKSEALIGLANKVDGQQFDALLRAAPKNERTRLYRLFEPEERLAYNCYLLGQSPETLPEWCFDKSYEASSFQDPAIVWKSGVLLRWVARQTGSYTFSHVVAWCLERYSTHEFADELVGVGDGANWSMTYTELEVFRWLDQLEGKGLVESDKWIPRRRKFLPTGKRISISLLRRKEVSK